MGSLGILGLGAYLPPTVRRNDWWPESIVDTWRKRLENIIPRSESAVEKPTRGTQMSLEAIAALKDDPFQGAVERRVADADMLSSDMEVRAATEALANAGIGVRDIDLLLTHTMVPDYLCVSPASIVQHKLGARNDCLAFGLDAVCSSFALQLQIAQQMIASGRARYALLTQSSACTRIMAKEHPVSAWFGDAATAVVVGPVDSGGLLASSFRSDGSLHGAFVASVPGKRWYDEGCVVACVEDPLAARRMQMTTADAAQEVVSEALASAGVAPADVGFYASHQPASWLRRVSQELCGLTSARAVDTFSWAGNLSSVNLPMQLTLAARDGMLSPGMNVALFGCGAGMSAVGVIMRWTKA